MLIIEDLACGIDRFKSSNAATLEVFRKFCLLFVTELQHNIFCITFHYSLNWRMEETHESV